MAKADKSKETDLGIQEPTYQKIIADINKEFGDICKPGSDILNRKQTILKISPSIDFGLNGGIPTGTWNLISGLPKTGKTTLALSIIAAAQKAEYDARHAYYLDVEGRLKSINLSGIYGLDQSKITVIRSTVGNVLSAEKYLKIAENIVHSHPGCILVVDSLSALCAEKELIGDMNSQTRSSGPKLIGQFCRKLANVVPINDVTVICMQHLIANTSGYGAAFMEDGGHKIQYQSDQKLRVKSIEAYTTGSGANEKRIGQIIHWNVMVSALGAIPGTSISSYLRYGVGFDHVREYIEQAVNFGIIEKSGAWFNFGEHKFQGIEKVWAGLNENPDLLEKVKEQIKETIGY